MSNARGFMGEKFPSKKFQKVIAEFLGRELESGKNPLADYMSETTIEMYQARLADYRMKVDQEALRFQLMATQLIPPAMEIPTFKAPNIEIPTPPPAEVWREKIQAALDKVSIHESIQINPQTINTPGWQGKVSIHESIHHIAPPSSEPIYSTAPTGDAIRLGACPPGFKRVTPEVMPKLSWDELYQENIVLRAELERLRAQQQS